MKYKDFSFCHNNKPLKSLRRIIQLDDIVAKAKAERKQLLEATMPNIQEEVIYSSGPYRYQLKLRLGACPESPYAWIITKLEDITFEEAKLLKPFVPIEVQTTDHLKEAIKNA